MAHLVDVADSLTALDRVSGTQLFLGGGADNMPVLDALKTHVRKTRAPKLIPPKSRGPIRGLEAIHTWLTGQGVELAVAGDRLVVKARRLDPSVREVIERFEPLLVGLLTEKPVPCALSHRTQVPAWTYAEPRLSVCEGCFRGER